MTADEMIEVIQAFKDGKRLEYKLKYGVWADCPLPSWDFDRVEYRIKPEPKKPQELWIGSEFLGLVGPPGTRQWEARVTNEPTPEWTHFREVVPEPKKPREWTIQGGGAGNIEVIDGYLLAANETVRVREVLE